MTWAQFLDVLPSIAAHPLAIVAYIITMVGWANWLMRVRRSRDFIKALERLPKAQRAVFCEQAGYKYDGLAGLSPAQRTRHLVHRQLLMAYLATLVAFTLIILSLIISLRSARTATMTNVGPGAGATQTAGRDIHNIQAGGNVTIGDPINVTQIAKEFRQPLRRMIEATEGLSRFLFLTDSLLYQAMDRGNIKRFAEGRMGLSYHAHEEWKKLEDVKKAESLTAELKQHGAGFPGGARMVSDIADAVAATVRKRIHDLPAQFIFPPHDNPQARALYKEPEREVGLKEGLRILNARRESHRLSEFARKQQENVNYTVCLLRAVCRFHLALDDDEIRALYAMREPDIERAANEYADEQWQAGLGVSWKVRLNYLRDYYRPLEHTDFELYAKVEAFFAHVNNSGTRNAWNELLFADQRR